MEMAESILGAHILVFPYPSQGHINPMLQFSKRLAFRGLQVTLVNTIFISKSTQPQTGSSIKVESISDGFDEGGASEAGSFDVYFERFEEVGSRTLAELLDRLDKCGNPVTCLIYDSVFTWTIGIAKRLGLVCVPFFTQSCAVDLIYYHVHHGPLSTAIQGPTILIPGLPSLAVHELPSFIFAPELYPSWFKVALRQFENYENADWILINSFEKLEEEALNWMAKQWRVKTIGPCLPSMCLDKRMEDDKDYGLNLFNSTSDDCIKWLNPKATGSVVYVSFGSLATLGEEQMEELARGLTKSNYYFLWVVRESEQDKLPSKFKEATSERGLVVTWCPQLDVLDHNSVGCFMTHCGWNSTLEALSLGVPMVAMPQWTDQTTNAKFIEDIWKVGLRVRVDDEGIVRGEEIERCINEIIEGERGKEITRNAVRWKELAREAVDEGGSSYKNIQEFVEGLATRI